MLFVASKSVYWWPKMIKITIKEHKLCPKKHYKRILQLLEHHYLVALLCFCVSLYTSHSCDYGFQENFEKDLERSGDGESDTCTYKKKTS